MCVRKLVWMLALFCWGAVAAVAADDGHKRTDKLIERIDETVKEMREGRKRMEKTLAAYHEVFSAGREAPPFRRTRILSRAWTSKKSVPRKFASASNSWRKRRKSTSKSGNKSLKDIKKGELRDRSAARLDETRKRYHELIRAGEQAQKGFRPVVEGLQDQVVYLGHDLNQTSVESLVTDRAKINDWARGLMARINSFVAAADAYVASLNP